MKTVFFAIYIFANSAMPYQDGKIKDTPTFIDGNQLKSFCMASDDETLLSFCNGYIAGILDDLNTNKMKPCFSTVGNRIGDHVIIVREYLNAFPNMLHFPAASLVEQATIMKFCR